MKKYQAVIFDLDGTLLDTLEDLRDSVNYIMRKYGFPEHSLEDIRKAVGNGIRNLMEKSVPVSTGRDVFEQAFADFKVYYKANCKEKTKPYEGILPLIGKLSEDGYKLAVVSNKNHEAVKELMPYYFGDVFDVVVGAMEEKKKKPAPDTTLFALEQLGIAGEQAIYVGDSQVDVETARNAGLEGIFVTWGFRSREELVAAGAERFADNTEELYSKIVN